MTVQDRKIPTHELTYARLRDMVLFGHLQPGQPVTIQGLVSDLEAGMTPVREAIRRLIAEGALTLLGNRRVLVPHLTPGLLDQIAFARLTIEPRLAELAAPRLTATIIARLEALDRGVDRAIRERYPRFCYGRSQCRNPHHLRRTIPSMIRIAEGPTPSRLIRGRSTR
jgi:DNA-binding GntR family transcriptional regulator